MNTPAAIACLPCVSVQPKLKLTLHFGMERLLQDFAALRWVRSKLGETGFFTQLDMIGDLDDPRDLFGMILRAT